MSLGFVSVMYTCITYQHMTIDFATRSVNGISHEGLGT